jgi:hypothetical protein
MKYRPTIVGFSRFLDQYDPNDIVGYAHSYYECPLAAYLKAKRGDLPYKVSSENLGPLWAKVFVTVIDDIYEGFPGSPVPAWRAKRVLDFARFATVNLSYFHASYVAYDFIMTPGDYYRSFEIFKMFSDIIKLHYGRYRGLPCFSEEVEQEARMVVLGIFEG